MRHNISILMGELGDFLRKAREKQDLKQLGVAKRLGLGTDVSVSKWENGTSPIPWHHIDKLINILQLPRDQFISLLKKECPDSVDRYESNVSGVICEHIAPYQSADLGNLPSLLNGLSAREVQTLERLAETFQYKRSSVTTHLINQVEILLQLLHEVDDKGTGHEGKKPQRSEKKSVGPS